MMKLNPIHKLLLTGLAMTTIFAPPSVAQLAFEGDESILVDANKATYKGALTILEGNVDVRQGEARILADKMNVLRERREAENDEPAELGLVTKIEAMGNFKYITPDNTVTGNRGVYERDKGFIIVTGDVKLIQPSGSQVTGEKLTYNIKSKSAKFGDTQTKKDASNRVEFTINSRN